jgi:hypothetical protein
MGQQFPPTAGKRAVKRQGQPLPLLQILRCSIKDNRIRADADTLREQQGKIQ